MDDLKIRSLALLDLLRARARKGGNPLTVDATPILRLDLHNHTRGSWDCLSDPEALLSRAAEKGVDRIAITDHNRLEVALEMYEKYPDRIIPGEEVKTGEGIDLIGLYLTRRDRKGHRGPGGL